MQNKERNDKILEYLKENKRAKVSELAQKMFVSETTVRRALDELMDFGLVERTHGGAVLHENADEISVFVRVNKNPKEKERVATVALSCMPEFGTVFLDSSTTALALAGRLNLSHKTVVTNNLQAAMLLSGRHDVSLIFLGGEVLYRSNSVAGSMTMRELSGMRFDLMLASCTAVEQDGAFENSLGQCEIKRLAFEQSRKRILLADSSKFQEKGTYQVASLSDFDLVVTDKQPPFPVSNIRFLRMCIMGDGRISS